MQKAFFFFLLSTILISARVEAFKAPKNSVIFKIKGYTEEKARAYFDNATDLHPIEGLYSMNGEAIVAIQKFKYPKDFKKELYLPSSPDFAVIYVSKPRSHFSLEKRGDVLGLIYSLSDSSFYTNCNIDTYHRYRKNHYFNQNVKIFDNGTLYLSIGNIRTIALQKFYPDAARKTPSKKTASRSTGSGFTLSSDGYIATCNHVVKGATTIHVTGVGGNMKQSYSARVVITDSINDLAIIKIDDSEFVSLGEPCYSIRRSSLREGDGCFAMGYPSSYNTGRSVKTTQGIISALKTPYLDSYILDINTYHGNSGGPIFDMSGNVLGVSKAGFLDYKALSIITKSFYLQELIDKVPGLDNLPQNREAESNDLSVLVENRKPHVLLIDIFSDGKTKMTAKFDSSVVVTPKIPLTTDSIIEKYNEYIRKNPNQAYGYFIRAYRYYMLKDYSRFLLDIQATLSRDSSYTNAYFMRALYSSFINNHVGAISDYEAILSLPEKRGIIYSRLEVYENLTQNYMLEKRYTQALHINNLAIDLDPKKKDNILIKAIILLNLERYKECIEILDAIIGKASYPGGLKIRGLAKQGLHDKNGACEDMREAMKEGDQLVKAWIEKYCEEDKPLP